MDIAEVSTVEIIYFLYRRENNNNKYQHNPILTVGYTNSGHVTCCATTPETNGYMSPLAPCPLMAK